MLLTKILLIILVLFAVALVADKLTAMVHEELEVHDIAPVIIHAPIVKLLIVNLFVTVEDKATPVLLVTAKLAPNCPAVGRSEVDKVTPLFETNAPLQFTVLVNVGDARGAFKCSCVLFAVDTGFNKSVVLSTLPKPTIALVILFTVPVNVGDARGAFKSSCVLVAVDTGFNKSVVLSTLPKPTIALVITFIVPVNVGESFVAFKSSCVVVLVLLYLAV